MRSYGRINQTNGVGGTWVQVDPDDNGLLDPIYLTTLIQTLRLNRGESPFWGNWGISARPSVVTQVFPDFEVSQTQTQFAGYFASLAIARVQGSFPPVYNAQVVMHNGATAGFPISTGQLVVPQ